MVEMEMQRSRQVQVHRFARGKLAGLVNGLDVRDNGRRTEDDSGVFVQCYRVEGSAVYHDM